MAFRKPKTTAAPRDERGGFRRRPGRRKVCRFCADKESRIDYKDARGWGTSSPNAGRSSRAASPGPARVTSVS